MKIFITKTFKGKEAGKSVREYVAGSTYDIECADLIKVITDQKWGELDLIADLLGDQSPVVVETASGGEYGLAAHEIALLPVKELKAIIKDEDLTVDPQLKKQAEIAEAVTEQLKLKYKGI
jgi:hypothetical protein